MRLIAIGTSCQTCFDMLRGLGDEHDSGPGDVCNEGLYFFSVQNFWVLDQHCYLFAHNRGYPLRGVSPRPMRISRRRYVSCRRFAQHRSAFTTWDRGIAAPRLRHTPILPCDIKPGENRACTNIVLECRIAYGLTYFVYVEVSASPTLAVLTVYRFFVVDVP